MSCYPPPTSELITGLFQPSFSARNSKKGNRPTSAPKHFSPNSKPLLSKKKETLTKNKKESWLTHGTAGCSHTQDEWILPQQDLLMICKTLNGRELGQPAKSTSAALCPSSHLIVVSQAMP